MTRSSLLHIHVHWHLLAPVTMNTKPKVVQYPSNLKTMLEKCEDQAYHSANINNKISCSSLLSLLEKVLANEGHFPTNQFTYSLNHKWWNTKTILYAVTSSDTNIKFSDLGNSSSTRINREMKAIQSEENWMFAINAAQEIYNETNSQSQSSKRKKKTNTTRMSSLYHCTSNKVQVQTSNWIKKETSNTFIVIREQ